ncbi:MAG: restriction endonuclease subunit S [Flammeovirgaceae bacterium]
MKSYDSYKDTGVEWIKDIPSHWDRQKLKYCGKIITGGTPSTKKNEYWDGDIPWIESGKIHFKKININDVDSFITELGFEKSSTKMVRKNSPVVALTGATCSNAGFLTFDSAINQSIVGIEANEFNSPYFLYYYLVSQKNQILSHQTGGAQGGVSKTVIQNLDIVKLDINEQHKIVSFLDTKTSLIDSLIEKTQQKIKLLKEKRNSLINEVVINGLNQNVEMKICSEEWIGEIPSHWEVIKMKYLVNHITEKGIPEKNDIKISPENVESDTGVCFNLYSEHESEGMIFQNGDILFNKLRLYLKKIILTEYDGYSLGEMIVLRTNNKLDNRYFYKLLFSQGLIDLLESQSKGVKLPRVSPDDILNTYIICPPIQEQQQIVEFLDKKIKLIDKTISLEEKNIELLKEYHQSLISSVVTGKRKVV